MLPEALSQALRPHLGAAIRKHASVGGGCIANASRLETDEGTYFLKWGRGEVAQTLPAEAAGLRALRGARSPLFVPDVRAVQAETEEAPGFLLMAWIEEGTRGTDFWEAFGQGLAALHRHTAERYGFDVDNFIGRLPQQNAWEPSWAAFFRAYRLEPQAAMARERGRWSSDWNAPFEALLDQLGALLPEQPPASVLHGDLWSGNFLVEVSGRAALIDPAAYYGHREADLAMTELFGGFSAPFCAAYREAWPLEPGYERRREVYNLYHLINHLNHFGQSYAGSVARILKRFG